MSSQVPPHDLDAEGVVLSASILDTGRLDEIRHCLRPTDFYSVPNRLTWEAILAVADAGEPVDVVRVATELRATGRLESVGGPKYLALLVDATPAVANVASHARTVAELGKRRRLIDVCKLAAAKGYGDKDRTGEWVSDLERAVFAESCSGSGHDTSVGIAEQVAKEVSDIDLRIRSAHDESAAEQIQTSYAAIQWRELKNLLGGGFRLGKLHILAGRPGMGKSAGAMGCALGAARAGQGVVFLSLEMTVEELTQRLLSSESEVPLTTLMAGEPSDAQWRNVVSAQVSLSQLPLRLVYSPGAKLSSIRSVLRREIARIKRDHGVDTALVVVDYIQIIDGERERGESREGEVSRISMMLMTLAGELNVAMLALSQLNREVDKRPNQRPALSDLRESGALEQNAYSVIFMYREAYYKRTAAWLDTVELNVAKHRNGSQGVVKLSFNPACVRFDDER